METVNPYQPPTSPTSPTSDGVPEPRRRFFAYLVPATLAVGVTLLVWVVLVSTLDGLMGHRFSLLLWASTLFLSSSISIVALNRLWRTATHPLAFGMAFAIFSVVFILAEGDTSNGADYWNMAIIYGTLLALPVAMCFLARCTARDRCDVVRPQDSG
jgi:hypothetical protein